MADLNSVTLSGLIVSEPELRQTPGGKNVAKLRIATSLGKRNGENRSAFTDVTVWGGQSDSFDLAQVVCERFAKKDHIQLTGQLDYEEWEDKGGNKRSKHAVIARDIELPPRTETTPAPVEEDIEF